MGIACDCSFRVVDEVMSMDILSKAGAKLVAEFFTFGFVTGLVVGVVGFTMAIDLMAGR